MEITINQQEDRLVAELIGDLDNAASTQAERGLAPVFERSDCDVVIDCSQLNYISSSGLRLLLIVYKHTHGCGHLVTLKGLKSDVNEVLLLSGFLPLFVIEK